MGAVGVAVGVRVSAGVRVYGEAASKSGHVAVGTGLSNACSIASGDPTKSRTMASLSDTKLRASADWP
jgi:hypothetical protein